MVISEAEAEAVISAPKQTVKKMEWLIKPKRSALNWYQYETACWLNNEVREDIYFRVLWRGEYPIQGQSTWKSEYISCGIFAANNRILAIDYDDTFHRNRAGTGLAYAGMKISGAHIHRFKDQDKSYAEPFELTQTHNRLEYIIKAVCMSGNITLTGGFIAPPSEQLPLI